MDTDSSFLATGNRIDYRLRTVESIPTGKNPVNGRLEGNGISLQTTRFGDTNPLIRDAFEVGTLAYGHDYRITIEGLTDALVEFWIETSAFIKDLTTALELDSGNPLIGLE